MFDDNSLTQDELEELVTRIKEEEDFSTLLLSGVSGLRIIDLENHIIYVVGEKDSSIVTMMTGLRGYPTVMGPPMRPPDEEDDSIPLSHNTLAS